MVYCSNCGKQLQDGNSICHHCDFQNPIINTFQTQQIATSAQTEDQSVGYIKWLETKTWAFILDMMAYFFGLMGLLLILVVLSNEASSEKATLVCFGGCGFMILAWFLHSKSKYYSQQVVLMK